MIAITPQDVSVVRSLLPLIQGGNSLKALVDTTNSMEDVLAAAVRSATAVRSSGIILASILFAPSPDDCARAIGLPEFIDARNILRPGLARMQAQAAGHHCMLYQSITTSVR